VHDCENVKVSGLVLKKGTKLVYQYPLKSSLFQIWQIKKITNEIVIDPINTIKNKLIFLKLNFSPFNKNYKNYVISLLHL